MNEESSYRIELLKTRMVEYIRIGGRYKGMMTDAYEAFREGRSYNSGGFLVNSAVDSGVFLPDRIVCPSCGMKGARFGICPICKGPYCDNCNNMSQGKQICAVCQKEARK